MDISDLHILEVIGQRGSLSEAALGLSMSQPTLSRRIDRLESRLGYSVLIRGSAGAQLTAAGQFLVSQGASLQRQMLGLERQAASLAEDTQNHLALGVGPLIEQLLFPKILHDFIDAQKRCRMSLKQMTTLDMVSAVEDGSLDLAFGPFDQSQVPEGLVREPLVSAPIVMAARADHPLTHHEGDLSLLDIVEFPRIGPPLPDYIARQLPDSVAYPAGSIECENYRICKSQVACSDYLTGGPEVLFREEVRQGVLVVLPVSYELTWHSYVLRRPGQLSLSAQQLLSIAQEYATFLTASSAAAR